MIYTLEYMSQTSNDENNKNSKEIDVSKLTMDAEMEYLNKVITSLRKTLNIKDHVTSIRIFRNSFRGNKAVDTLIQQKTVSTRSDAINLLKLMIKRHLLEPLQTNDFKVNLL